MSLTELNLPSAVYLLQRVIEGSWLDDGESDEEYIGLRITQRSKSIVILLTGGVPMEGGKALMICHTTSL